ncbi:hypothetical protein VTN00DRAFT_4632 [Thermoascus crustaceus]|uniref:uncharacterized protein n=1 Tax=Thermoascus crustaceus TaxID=5088 RepID=UPI0037449F85
MARRSRSPVDIGAMPDLGSAAQAKLAGAPPSVGGGRGFICSQSEGRKHSGSRPIVRAEDPPCHSLLEQDEAPRLATIADVWIPAGLGGPHDAHDEARPRCCADRLSLATIRAGLDALLLLKAVIRTLSSSIQHRSIDSFRLSVIFNSVSYRIFRLKPRRQLSGRDLPAQTGWATRHWQSFSLRSFPALHAWRRSWRAALFSLCLVFFFSFPIFPSEDLPSIVVSSPIDHLAQLIANTNP